MARESLIPCDPLFPAEAEAALETFKALRVVDMPGSPTMGEVSRPWVLNFVASIFGAYDPETGRRLIREWFLLISKKNTKSTTAAGVMLTALLLNWRQSGEFGILAPTIEVANNAFKPARDMVKADDELEALLHVQEHVRTITHRETGATLQVVAADTDAVAGKKWIVTLVDELWLFGKRANAHNMLLEATGGMASRPEGFVIYLSTQSDEPPAGVFKQKLEYARGVRDGRINDPEFLPVLYEHPRSMLDDPDEPYLKPENFYITNPNLGASVDERFILRKLKEAQEGGDDAESPQSVLAKFLNIEIGQRLAASRWAGADFWETQVDTTLTFDELLRRSEVITMGGDGGGLDDLLGLSAIGRERVVASDGRVTHRWLEWAHAWAHESVLERRKSIASKLRDFARDGDLTIVAELGQDIAEFAEYVRRADESGKLDRLGLDPAGIGAVVDAVTEVAQLDAERIVGISQGWKLMGAIKTAERKLAEGTLLHGGQPLMAWCVGNAKREQKGNAMLITKQASGTAKIDPLMAMFNAIALMSMNPEAKVIGDDYEAMVI